MTGPVKPGHPAPIRADLGGETPIGDAGTHEKVLGREPLRPPLPKRFYTAAAVDEHGPSYRILLDGRPVKTPKKQPLSVPHVALAEAIAAEWMAQGTHVDPATMPLTRMANTALDGVTGNEDGLRADIAAFAMSDLLCYRADGPDTLVSAQAARWDPVLDWAAGRLGCRFRLAVGIMPVTQPEPARGAMLAVLAPACAFELTALHVVTTLTGSALLALALAERRLDAEAVWSAAHVDEDFQIAQWGWDAEAKGRRAHRWAEMQAAARILTFAAKS